MELRHLRYFVALAHELHYGRAAGQLRIAQPALSQQIIKLETELGVQLLERSSRRVRLTQQGSQLLEYAQRTLHDADALTHLAQKMSRGQAGLLRLGAISPATFKFLPSVLREFVKSSDGVDVSLHVMDTPQQVAAMLEDRLDVGLVRPWVQNELIFVEELFHERMLLAVSSDHPLAERNKVWIREFAQDPFVTYPRERGAGYYDLVVGICRRAGFYPHIRQELDEIYTILTMVAAGLGVAILPEPAVLLRIPGVTYLPLRDATAHAGVCLAWPAYKGSPLTTRFISTAKSVAATLSAVSP